MKKSIVHVIAALMAAAVLAFPTNPQPARAATGPLCYVNASATGSNTGDSRADAYTSLYVAMLDGLCEEFWVAAGVYKPDASSINNSFWVTPGEGVYGGFTGTETDRSQRDPEAHVTVMSGDIDNNDTNTDGNSIAESFTDIQGSNTRSVVFIVGTGSTPVVSTTVLDGFTITGGDAGNTMGGGLMCQGNGAGKECSPTLKNLVFSGNGALGLGGGGGGIYNDGTSAGISSPTLTHVVFRGNGAQFGGAMYNNGNGGTSSPTLTDVTFEGNSATYYGGAIYDYGIGGVSSPVLKNVTFEFNHADLSGGAIMNEADTGVSSPSLGNVTFQGNNSAAGMGGAMYNDVSTGWSAPILRNVTFRGNFATYGGAMYNRVTQVGGTTNPQLDNVILWGDNATTAGNEIYNFSASVVIRRSVIQGGCGSIAGADCSSGDNQSTDPLLGPLADNGGFARTMSLTWGSSAINIGDDMICGSVPVGGADERGITRPQGEHCDIGALERVPYGKRADFESDGLSDIGYFRASTGVWAILESSKDFSYARPRYYSWGQTGDILALGDYDGDGRMDPTVRRPPAGGQSAAYRMLLSTTGYDFGSTLTIPAGWPGIGDTPVPGDYNGDGISDPAIWRGSSGVWIIPLSPAFSTYQFFSWGANGDTPVAADVDGDLQTDIGYWRPSTGVWGFLQSSQGYSYANALWFSWGSPLDKPVMADYDGDDLADPAVVIPPASGQSQAYRILLSTQSYNPAMSVTIPAGWPGLGDTPVPGDYDGDGLADAGIWRANAGVWIIPKSSDATYMFAAWGAAGDSPAR